MSLQDDYFDARQALEGQPEQKCLDRIWQEYCELDRAYVGIQELMRALEVVKRFIKRWWMA